MQRSSARVDDLALAIYPAGLGRVGPTGRNEATWAAAARQGRADTAQAAVAEFRRALKYTWIVTVTALAGQRRLG